MPSFLRTCSCCLLILGGSLSGGSLPAHGDESAPPAATSAHTTRFAQTTSADLPALMKRAAAQSEEYWQGEYWGDEKFPAGQRVYSGRNAHYCTLMYWSLLDAKLNGNQQSLSRALTHYRYITEHFWDSEKGLFRTDYDFLMNASIGLALGLCVRDAGTTLSPELRQEILNRLRTIAAFLPTYNTSLLKTADNTNLRANNQEAFAAFALAVAGELLQDTAIRQAALVKLRSVLAIVQQSFWIEGGVDIGYQSVGEPAFMAAADLLWDDLNREERGKLADLALSNRVGNGFGLENCRSSSWLRPEGARIFESALLARVANPFIAADARQLLRETTDTGMKSKWWLHDPASLSFFSGFVYHPQLVSAPAALSDRFAWGSLAVQGMERDEQKDRYNYIEKGFLTSECGVTAIFGDYSRFNPAQAFVKFGNQRAPRCWNPGGMRYLGRNGHLYLWADDVLGCPRLAGNDRTAYPQLYRRQMLPGFAASQYHLTQAMPGYDDGQAVLAEQTFVTAGPALLMILRSAADLRGLRLELTLPAAAKPTGTASDWRVAQDTSAGGKTFLRLALFHCGEPAVDRDTWKPYFKNKIGLPGKSELIPPAHLSRLTIPFAGGNLALALFLPGDDPEEVRDIALEESAQSVALKFSTADAHYTIVTALRPLPELALAPRGGTPVTLTHPVPGAAQVIVTDAASPTVRGLTAHARSAKLAEAPVFAAEQSVYFSALRLSDGRYALEARGQMQLFPAFGASGQSLIDQRTFPLPATVRAERLLTH